MNITTGFAIDDIVIFKTEFVNKGKPSYGLTVKEIIIDVTKDHTSETYYFEETPTTGKREELLWTRETRI